MSSTSIDLGGGGNSFPFEAPGDTVTGHVIGLENVQQTDMETGQPAFWSEGQPKMMVRVELKTELKDDESDDGKRSIYLRGSRKPESQSSLSAVLAAVRKATGGTEIAAGGLLTLTFTEEGVPTKRGFNAPKHYSASYTPPALDLGKKDTEEPKPTF